MPSLPDALAATLSRHLPLSNSRRETLAVVVIGLVCGRTVNLSHIAGQFRGPARLASNYRRLQRFFQFVRLDEDWLARTLVALLQLRPPFRLCLDRTNWKVGTKPVNLLVLCIVTRRIRIPILWSVLDNGGGSSVRQRKALMERYVKIFGVASITMLLADREFVGSKWFEFLVENNIPFAIRVSGRLIVALDDGRVAPLASLTRKSTWRRLAKGRFQGMPARFASTLAFAAKRRGDGALIIVATNRQPLRALADYKKRWQIECLFGDTKTRGLNMEDTRLTQPAKLSLLMAIVALALTWATGGPPPWVESLASTRPSDPTRGEDDACLARAANLPRSKIGGDAAGCQPYSLSSLRRILPTLVFGRSLRNSICLGRL